MLQRLLVGLMVGAVGLFVGTANANAVPVAISLDGTFELGANADIFNATTIPHTTVQGYLFDQNQIDWYSFTGTAGATFYADHDGDPVATLFADSMLWLFSSSGDLLAADDDSPLANKFPVDPNLLDPGSLTATNAFLGAYTLPSDDTYYLALTSYAQLASVAPACTGLSSLSRPDGVFGGWAVSGCPSAGFTFNNNGEYKGPYTLNISLTPLPEPETYAMLLTGLGLMGFAMRHRRQTSTHG